MGREIRKVPAGWKHPDNKPMYDQDFESAASEWKDSFVAWENGERPSYFSGDNADDEFWEYEGPPPDREYYRPKWTDEERTHYMVYETVSEGTPVTPAFPNKATLVQYLVERGDFWDQKRGDGGWDLDAAESFVKNEWAPSMIVTRTGNAVDIKTPRDMV